MSGNHGCTVRGKRDWRAGAAAPQRWHSPATAFIRPVPVDITALDHLLRAAITERRLVRFTLADCNRIAEPHDYGIQNGRLRLLFFQIGGESSSGTALGWRWADLDKISRLELLDDTFAGARATPSGKHVAWDELRASVSRAGDALGAAQGGRRKVLGT